MENYIILGLVVVAIVLLKLVVSNFSTKRKVFKDNVYSYGAKSLMMTRTESEFFTKLDRVVSERYYVFPQVHLSALLDHKVKGQDWRFAFRHINGKSVDFVLCDRETLRPMYAIELDDLTHEQSDRRKRDIEVERIFEEANLPLVRFKNKDVSETEIIQALSNARKLTESN
jgi:very-short-patch-repair endonuclease